MARDMIGLATTNALPTMAPWGGISKIVGINPLAIAIPADRQPPIVFDAAFSGSSHGKIRVYHRKSLPIPDDWAFDKQGQPTTDPAAALDGSLQPIGRYKGTGLAIVMGILGSVLSGAAYGTELGDMVSGAKAGRDGQFLMALHVAAFEQPLRFKRRVDGIIAQICASTRREGFQRIYAPGGLEAETEQLYRTNGIPLDSVTVESLSSCAADLQVDANVLAGWCPQPVRRTPASDEDEEC
jgi:LDH2 family malate/lactate/ureidoglycolate dehydrogenase